MNVPVICPLTLPLIRPPAYCPVKVVSEADVIVTSHVTVPLPATFPESAAGIAVATDAISVAYPGVKDV